MNNQGGVMEDLSCALFLALPQIHCSWALRLPTQLNDMSDTLSMTRSVWQCQKLL